MPESNFQPFQTTQQDATNVPTPDPRMEAIVETHDNTANEIALNSVAAGAVTFGNTRDPAKATAAVLIVGVANTWNSCVSSCHAYNPPLEPPYTYDSLYQQNPPEIETGEEDEKKEKENDN